jgi:type III secretion protein O
MISAYEQLLELKQRKEEHATAGLHAARLALEQAALLVERHRREAEHFSRALDVRQANLFDELQKDVRSRQEVEDVRQEIVSLRSQEAALYKRAEETEARRVEAAQAMEEARLAHMQAAKSVEKFRQLVTDERAMALVHEQAEEDKENEDILRLEPEDA